MAACRPSIPLRSTAGLVRVNDGTMCRMPSPLPGPLRGEPLDPNSRSDSGSLEGVSSVSGAFESENAPFGMLVENASQPVRKVA